MREISAQRLDEARESDHKEVVRVSEKELVEALSDLMVEKRED